MFVSLLSRDSVYDVLRRICTHLEVTHTHTLLLCLLSTHTCMFRHSVCVFTAMHNDRNMIWCWFSGEWKKELESEGVSGGARLSVNGTSYIQLITHIHSFRRDFIYTVRSWEHSPVVCCVFDVGDSLKCFLLVVRMSSQLPLTSHRCWNGAGSRQHRQCRPLYRTCWETPPAVWVQETPRTRQRPHSRVTHTHVWFIMSVGAVHVQYKLCIWPPQPKDHRNIF